MADRLEINKKEKALLIGVIYEKLDQFKVEEHLSELELLAKTAGAKVVGKITQKISRINPSYFIGSGKAEQIIKQADENRKRMTEKNYQKRQKSLEALQVIEKDPLMCKAFLMKSSMFEGLRKAEEII